jgi:hypothetical protein
VVYDGAIYLHQGRSYQCTSLDLKERIAYVRPVRGTKYYTSVRRRGWGGGGQLLCCSLVAGRVLGSASFLQKTSTAPLPSHPLPATHPHPHPLPPRCRT